MKDPKITSMKVAEGPDGLLEDLSFTAKTTQYNESLEFSSLGAMDAFIESLILWRERVAAIFPETAVSISVPIPAWSETPNETTQTVQGTDVPEDLVAF